MAYGVGVSVRTLSPPPRGGPGAAGAARGRAALADRLAPAAKRAIDLAGACLGLALLLVPLLVLAAAVRLDSPGPALFRQRRRGLDGRTFVIWKLRTMTCLEDGAEVRQATRADPRVTRLGAILRRSSLDELPQLVNVLRGEMSLVGPRPHALAHDDQYGRLIGDYARRRRMRPGLTGWAQVNGLRGGTPDLAAMSARVVNDLWYIDHWSLALDLRVLLLTARRLLAREAY